MSDLNIRILKRAKSIKEEIISIRDGFPDIDKKPEYRKPIFFPDIELKIYMLLKDYDEDISLLKRLTRWQNPNIERARKATAREKSNFYLGLIDPLIEHLEALYGID